MQEATSGCIDLLQGSSHGILVTLHSSFLGSIYLETGKFTGIPALLMSHRLTAHPQLVMQYILMPPQMHIQVHILSIV